MIRLQQTAFPVPFRDPDALAQHLVVRVLRGQIQVELERQCGALATATDGHAVQVAGDGLRLLAVLLVLAAPVHLDILAPGKDVLHAHRDQAAIGLRPLHPLGLPVQLLHLPLARARHLVVSGLPRPVRLAGRQRGIGMQPQRHRLRRASCARQPLHAAGRIQGLAYRPLCGGLVLRQALWHGAGPQMCLDQAPVAILQTGVTSQGEAYPGLVGVKPVAAGLPAGRGQRRQPQVQIPVQGPRRQPVDLRRQAQEAFVAPCQRDLEVAARQALQPVAAGPVFARLGTADLQAAVAAQGAKQHPYLPLHLGQADRRLWVAGLGQAGDQPMPERADLLLHSALPGLVQTGPM